MKYTDEELIAMCNNPKQQNLGYEKLIAKYNDKLYWQIRRIVQHHDDADEVLQIVWVKVWQNLDKFKGNSALSTWMYRIAYNESLTYLKAQKKQNLADWDNVEPVIGTKENFDDSYDVEIEKENLMQSIDEAIETLPEKQKLIFQYRYNDELPYSQIAEITGTSEGALKASFHHAVKKIEKYVKKKLNQ